MGKPRVRGSHAEIFVIAEDTKETVKVGEISKFSVKELGEIKKSRTMGDQEVTANKTFEGYDLSFEGGKVDWNLASMLHNQDKSIVAGNRAPLFKIRQKITYYGNRVEVFEYSNVVLYGYNLDMDANDEMMEKFEGFCGKLRKLVDDASSDEIKSIDGAFEKALADLVAKQTKADE